MMDEKRRNRINATSAEMSATSEATADSTDSSEALVKSGSSIIGQRMTIAGVFFDIALFVADVEHLKFVMDSGRESIDNYNLLLGLLSTSMSLQLLVAILLFIRGFSDAPVATKATIEWTRIVDNVIVGLVSAIALVNLLATVFGDRPESVQNYSRVHNCSAQAFGPLRPL